MFTNTVIIVTKIGDQITHVKCVTRNILLSHGHYCWHAHRFCCTEVLEARRTLDWATCTSSVYELLQLHFILISSIQYILSWYLHL